MLLLSSSIRRFSSVEKMKTRPQKDKREERTLYKIRGTRTSLSSFHEVCFQISETPTLENRRSHGIFAANGSRKNRHAFLGPLTNQSLTPHGLQHYTYRRSTRASRALLLSPLLLSFSFTSRINYRDRSRINYGRLLSPCSAAFSPARTRFTGRTSVATGTTASSSPTFSPRSVPRR